MPEIDRQQAYGKEVSFRGDAAFAKPELYEALEQRNVRYAIRLPANDNLERKITRLLTRPVGRPATSRWSATRAFSTKCGCDSARSLTILATSGGGRRCPGDRQLVAHQPAAAGSEDWRPSD